MHFIPIPIPIRVVFSIIDPMTTDYVVFLLFSATK